MNGAKLLDAMRANPRDWRIADIERVCAAFGAACTAPRKDSHDKVAPQAMPMILTIPAHRPIKPVYIRDLIRFMDAVRERDS